MVALTGGGVEPPVTWYGGKNSLAPLIVSLLPPHQTYVEPFGGSAAVLMAKPSSPVEVYTDLHDGIVPLYQVLRDPSLFGELQRLCELTPYSREQHRQCRSSWQDEEDLVRKAWGFFIAARQGFSGLGSRETPPWGFSVESSRRGMSASVSKWLSAIDGLPAVHHRLRTVQVDRGTWQEVVARYDATATLFYLDPPYVPATREGIAYTHELALEHHEDLVRTLLQMKGMVVLSGYDHPCYAPLEINGWERRTVDTVSSIRTPRGTACARPARTESIWSNPAAVAARSQPSLFSNEEVPRG